MKFKKNQVVRDQDGNHFRVVSELRDGILLESVATKETFIIPEDELELTDLRPR